MNDREDKVCYNLWMTEEEERLLLQNMKSLPSLVWMILKKAYKRGDFEKQQK